MKAFVTGATGLLGSNLVRALVAEGHEVTALARGEEKARHQLAGLPVRIVMGDMQDVEGFTPSLAGAEVVFHTAAYFRDYYQPGAHEVPLRAVNVDGALALFRAARRAGVQRIVHTGTSGLIGPPRPDQALADEGNEPGPETTRNRYYASKLTLDQALRQAVAEEGLPVLSILPGWMFGPGDLGPTTAGQLVQDFLARRLPGIPPGGTHVADARDVARGMLAMVQRGTIGERYIVAGPVVSLAEILVLLEEVSGVPAPRLRIPYGLALCTAAAMDAWARLTGGRSSVPLEGIRTLRHPVPLSSAKAERELGVTLRPLRDTLADTVAWFRAQEAATRGGSRSLAGVPT